MLNLSVAVTVIVVISSLSPVTAQDACKLVCKNGGILHRNTCSCDCLGYWTGNMCDLCNLDYCENGGTLRKDTCLCDCKSGWVGKTCETYVVKGKDKSGGHISEGASAAIITNVMVGTVALIVLVGIYLWKKQQKRNEDKTDERSHENSTFQTHTEHEI